jgi:hypothetical protein
MNAGSGQCGKFHSVWSAYTDAGQGGTSMASTRSDPRVTSYPRLHVEMRRLSDAAILVDGWLIEGKGVGRSVLNYCGSMEEAREQISKCASKYGAKCDDEDIVLH